MPESGRASRLLARSAGAAEGAACLYGIKKGCSHTHVRRSYTLYELVRSHNLYNLYVQARTSTSLYKLVRTARTSTSLYEYKLVRACTVTTYELTVM